MTTPDFFGIPSPLTLAPLRDAALALCPKGYRVRVNMAITMDGRPSIVINSDAGPDGGFSETGWGLGATPEACLDSFRKALKADPVGERIAQLRAELATLEALKK